MSCCCSALAGRYTVRFSRGHGTDLTKAVTVAPPAGSGAAAEARGGAPLLLSEFPSRWVEGHGVTVEACVEGTTDVIPRARIRVWGGFPAQRKQKRARPFY